MVASHGDGFESGDVSSLEVNGVYGYVDYSCYSSDRAEEPETGARYSFRASCYHVLIWLLHSRYDGLRYSKGRVRVAYNGLGYFSLSLQ